VFSDVALHHADLILFVAQASDDPAVRPWERAAFGSATAPVARRALVLCRRVFAVTQLLNRRDGRPFDEPAARRYAEFASSLSVLLESLARIDAGERRVSS
jgi:hypothetical protein